MPTYCFRKPDDTLVEVVMTISEMLSKQKKDGTLVIDGVKCVRDIQAEQDPVARNRRPGCWPMVSDAVGVHPDQVIDAQKHAEKIGVPTRFNALGQAIFESPGHRKAYCERTGRYDRNAGYGDPQKRR